MSASYNDNTFSYVPSTDDTGQRRMALPNPPLGRSGSGLSASWPTPSTRAGASMPSRSRKTARATLSIPAISLYMFLPTSEIQVKLAPLRVPAPRQAMISKLSGTYMRTPWDVILGISAGNLRSPPVQLSSVERIPKTLYQTDPWCVCSVVKYL
jgi:hypothetical protein